MCGNDNFPYSIQFILFITGIRSKERSKIIKELPYNKFQHAQQYT